MSEVNQEILVSVRGLSKVYEQGSNKVTALSDIDLDIVRGEFTSLSGPSGSGKSTLLNLIGGLDKPTAGSINLDGNLVHLLSSGELAKMRLFTVGFIFQSYNLIPVLSARENVEFVMQLQGESSRSRRIKATEILEEVGLAGLENRRPGELSGGQQQRVAVARAIVSRPKLVLADEPTANLDSATAKSLLELMKHMNEAHGVTFIFSTHDPQVISYARRRVKLQDGKIIEDSRNS